MSIQKIVFPIVFIGGFLFPQSRCWGSIHCVNNEIKYFNWDTRSAKEFRRQYESRGTANMWLVMGLIEKAAKKHWNWTWSEFQRYSLTFFKLFNGLDKRILSELDKTFTISILPLINRYRGLASTAWYNKNFGYFPRFPSRLTFSLNINRCIMESKYKSIAKSRPPSGYIDVLFLVKRFLWYFYPQ